VSPALLADLVLIAHLAFIVLVIFGGLLAFRWRGAILLHLPALIWGAWIELTGGVCPLTPIENDLRRAAGGAGYEESFIEHYIVPIVYPAGLTPGIQIGLGVALIVTNLALYAGVVRHWARRRARERRRIV
jgi:hypothetical protein